MIDTATNTITNEITVGDSPWGVAVNPAGTKAYVTNTGDGTVSVITIGSPATTTATKPPLATTGVDPAPVALDAAILLLAGAVLPAIRRRRIQEIYEARR